jgi:hypothetical protein
MNRTWSIESIGRGRERGDAATVGAREPAMGHCASRDSTSCRQWLVVRARLAQECRTVVGLA